MERILDRYVQRDLWVPFCLGAALLTFFLIVDRIFQLTDLVVTKGVPLPMVLGLLVFMLPSFLAHTLPMALLVAVLLVLGRLAGDLEVVALKAAGVSPLRLFRPFLLAACLVALATGLLTLWLNPLANRTFERQLVKIVQTRAASAIKERVFNTTFGQLVLYVDEVSPSQVALYRVLVSDERDPKLSRIITAREGRLFTDEENNRITLRLLDGAINESDPKELERYRYATFGLYDLNLAVDAPFKGAPRVQKPEQNLTLRRLLAASDDLRRKKQIVAPYEVELHKRFALPLAAVVFILVGFPLAIRMERGGRAIALGGSLAIITAYYMVLITLEGFAQKGWMAPRAAIWAPTVLFGSIGLVLLRSTLALPGRMRWVTRLWRRLKALSGLRVAAVRRRAAPVAGRRVRFWIIDRYMVREYVTYLAYGLAVGIVLFVIVDLLQTLDKFLRIKPPLPVILEHFIYRAPEELYRGFPIVVLVATIFLFLSMARQHELTALKAAGVSLYRVSRPVLLLALGISAAAVVFQETLLPALNARAEEVDRIKIKGEPPRHLQRRTQLWYRNESRFYRIDLLDPVGQSMDGVTLLELGPDSRLLTRIDARRARWTADGWEFRDGVFRTFGDREQTESVPFHLTALEIPERLEDFTQIHKSIERMNFLELREYLARLQESGRKVAKYLVLLYEKLAFPLINVVLALVAIPFALAAPRRGRLIGIGLAIPIAIGYWVVHSLALSFAKAEMLPPLLAAWTANIVFAGLGLSLFLRLRT